MSFIEALISSLIVAVVTGLTFVAYRHPNVYGKIFAKLLYVVSSAILFILAWNYGGLNSNIRSLGETLKDYPEQKIQNSSFIITNMIDYKYYINMTIVVGLLVTGYLFFLYMLPAILEIDKNKKTNVMKKKVVKKKVKKR